MQSLHGVYPALITPFNDGAVDLETFRLLVRRQLDAGVAGLVPCGTTGETPTLSDEEWTAVVRTTLEVAEGAVPVVAGCGSNSTQRTVATLHKAKELGVDAALVVLPYYNKPNPAGHRAHIEACSRVGVPLVLYHVPGRTGQHLPVQQLADLCNMEGVVAIKEATGDVTYGQHLMALTDRAVLSGDDFTFAPMMCMGAVGVISVISNVAPQQTVQFAEAAAQGDVQSLRAWAKRLDPVTRYLFSESNPVPAKAILAAMGLARNELRLPLVPTQLPPAAIWEGLS